ncbi:MAG: hypothetical protein IJZ61_06330 [Oscillospiraceae bacterium]|nr:hypothetical protein [Oscillospiraceae bacterium]
MIKGVNRRIVEITSTEHDYFEKAVLYVKTDKSGLPAEKITEEAREYLGRIIPVRRKNTLSLTAKLLIACVGIMTLILASCLIIFL